MELDVIVNILLKYTNHKMRYLLLTSFLFLSHLTFGQFQKIVNQSIDLSDATQVEVNLNGEVSYQEWEGTFMLIETKVVIENCNENIFRSFVATGRYLVNSEVDGKTVRLSSHKSLGQVVKSKLGETVETVYFKIYYPKGFKDSAGNLLVSTIHHEQVSGGK